jgi:glucose-1-phosphate adenylyltransferase
VATEIFLYEPATLLAELRRLRAELSHDDEDGSSGLGDFGDHLLPALVARGRTHATAIQGYWRDLGRPEVYLRAHRDLLSGRVDVFDRPGVPILTRWPERPPARIHAEGVVVDSMLSAGCVVRGTVRRSVLGPGSVVEKGAVVEDAVLGADVLVAAGARVSTSIVDDGCRIGRGAVVGAATPSSRTSDGAIAMLGRDCRVAASAVVAPGARLEPGSRT